MPKISAAFSSFSSQSSPPPVAALDAHRDVWRGEGAVAQGEADGEVVLRIGAGPVEQGQRQVASHVSGETGSFLAPHFS